MSAVLRIVRRSDGVEGTSFDVTGQSPRELERLWDGLVMRIDFAEWCPQYEPERGDDESLGDWVKRCSK